MQSRDFCYWLQGFFELVDANPRAREGYALTAEQVANIKAHLALVFAHEIDPSHGTPKHREALSKIHETGKKTPGGKQERADRRAVVVHHHHEPPKLMC
jgi:hypothetical protein